jgi:signal transduction histidine kinase
MSKCLLAAATSLALVAAAPAFAQAKNGSKDEAVAMVKKAVAHIKAAGKAKAFADFTAKASPFVDRDLYVYTADMTGKVAAHGANEKLIGRDLKQIKDADGKVFVAEILEKAQGGKPAWTDYKWVNPTNKEIEQKSAYCEPTEGHVVCVGVYK